jgi:hypothetical protein
MPTITLENDPAVYNVEIKSGQTISVNVLVLSANLAKRGISPSVENTNDSVDAIVMAARECAYPADIVSAVDDAHLFAFATTALSDYERLGK